MKTFQSKCKFALEKSKACTGHSRCQKKVDRFVLKSDVSDVLK